MITDLKKLCEFVSATEGEPSDEDLRQLYRDVILPLANTTFFAADSEVAAARNEYCMGTDDDIEVDDVALLSPGAADGVFVQAWVWLPHPDDGWVETPESSNVLGYEYKAADQKLLVAFKSNPDTDYEYSDVPVAKYRELKAAKSVGSFLAKEIKGKFPCQKHSEVLD